MNPEDIARIRAARAKGVSYTIVSQMTGFSPSTCRRYCVKPAYGLDDPEFVQPDHVVGIDHRVYDAERDALIGCSEYNLEREAIDQVPPYLDDEFASQTPSVSAAFRGLSVSPSVAQEAVEEGAYSPWQPIVEPEILDGLTSQQQDAIIKLVHQIDQASLTDRRRFMLRGYAGSGKTFLLQRALAARPRLRWRFTAPTHKATKVLADVLKGSPVEVGTLHQYLALVPNREDGVEHFIQDQHRAPNGLEQDVLVIDEASMVGPELLDYVDGLRTPMIVMVGDPAQLFPVGLDRLSPSMTDWGEGVMLDHVIRQEGDSPVLEFAQRVRTAQDDLKDWPAITNVEVPAGRLLQVRRETWREMALDEFRRTNPLDNPENAVILAYTNATVDKANRVIRTHLFGKDVPEYKEGEHLIAQGPIMAGRDQVLAHNSDMLLVTGKPLRIDDCDDLWDLVDEDDPTFHRMEKVLRFQFERVRIPILAVPVRHLLTNAEFTLPLVPKTKATAYAALIEDLAQTARRAPKGTLERRRAWASMFSTRDAIARVKHSYAMTVHKAQGSTFNHVFLDTTRIIDGPPTAGSLRLLYTAVTRPRHSLVVTHA